MQAIQEVLRIIGEVIYSVGWALTERERAALALVPDTAWQAAIDGKGKVRERRADDACADRRCAHRQCWIEEAHVTELTGLLREGPAGDQLKTWPKTMRVFARRERPHPGAQLTLFGAEDGWRYTLWATNRPVTTRGWLGQCAYIDAAHRVHARVEDVILLRGSIRCCTTWRWSAPARAFATHLVSVVLVVVAAQKTGLC